MGTVLVTNVRQYAGPGAVAALLGDHHRVLGHDASFADGAARAAFEAAHPGCMALAAAEPAELQADVLDRFGVPDAVVSNDVHPIAQAPIESLASAEFRSTFEAVVLRPVQLVQQFLPGMKARGRGSFVFVTSAREQRPEPGYALPTAARAAATAFAKALAIEAAPHGIQVNAVAPNYLESELYYPAARFADTPEGREAIRALVPFGRLGRQEEIGALIAFLASGRSPFMTGQVIRFTGGWSL